MRSEVLAALRCPVCLSPLALAGPSVRCGGGHSFDVARQGYLNLLTGHRTAGSADTAPMVADREAFLGGGAYDRVVEALASLVARTDPAREPGVVLDLAGGTGHHLAAVLEALPGRAGVCLDVSKPALRRAARAHDRMTAVGADAWQRLPLGDATVSTVTSVFGPRSVAEVRRVLVRGGVLVLVTPEPEHLQELVGPLGMLRVDADKPRRLAEATAAMEPVAGQVLTYEVRLGHADLRALAGMGPGAHHVTAPDLARRVAALPDPTTVTVSVRLAAHRRG